MLKSRNKLLHKALAFVLTFSLLASLISFNFMASAEITGKGTANDPYTISTLDDLKTFANSVNTGDTIYTNAYVKLADNSDITIADSWTPIGNAEHKFTGVFDGNGKTITFNNGISDGEYVGLFGINEGTIKNVKVAGSTISSSTEKAFVGGVAGLNRGTIINCENGATIKTTGVNSYAGGIAGVMQNGTIESCKNTGAITVAVPNNSSSDVTNHEASAGGIVAFNYNGTVKKCENTANATITNNETYGYTGGIVGNNDGTINNCLNGGTVSNTDNNGAQYAGGIAGNLFTNKDTGSTATISNCLNINASGAIVGTNGANSNAGTVTNSYYKADSDSDNDNIEGTTAVTDGQLKSGDVTYKLNGNTAANPVWGQTIGENNLPMIGAAEDSTVYPTTDGGYTNDKKICNNHNYSNGACTVCGDVVAKFSGTSVKLDGEIIFVFHFSVKNDATVNTVEFTKNEIKSSGTPTKGKANGEYFEYTAEVNINSDQLNLPVTAELSLTYNGTSMIVKSSEMSVNKYLNKLYSNPGEKYAQEIKNVASAMSTYGYYANEYFKVYDHYEPSIPMTALEITPNELSSYTISYNNGDNNLTELKHYATSFQHLETVAGVFYVQRQNNPTVPDGTVMQYTVKKNGSVFEDMQNKIAGVTSGATGYNWAVTDKIPVSELKNITFEVTFGNQTSGTYQAQTVTKTYSPYCYIRMTLAGNDEQSVNYKFTQALYHYSEAANEYFNASSQS